MPNRHARIDMRYQWSWNGYSEHCVLTILSRFIWRHDKSGSRAQLAIQRCTVGDVASLQLEREHSRATSRHHNWVCRFCARFGCDQRVAHGGRVMATRRRQSTWQVRQTPFVVSAGPAQLRIRVTRFESCRDGRRVQVMRNRHARVDTRYQWTLNGARGQLLGALRVADSVATHFAPTTSLAVGPNQPSNGAPPVTLHCCS